MRKLTAFAFVLGLCTAAVDRAAAAPACWMEDGVGGDCWKTKKLCEDHSSNPNANCSNRNAMTGGGGTAGGAAGSTAGKPAAASGSGAAAGAAAAKRKAGAGKKAGKGPAAQGARMNAGGSLGGCPDISCNSANDGKACANGGGGCGTCAKSATGSGVYVCSTAAATE